VAAEKHEDEEVKRVVDTVDSLHTVEDPTERARRAGALLAEWPVQAARLREIRQAAVQDLRTDQVSYRNIAKALGLSVARVQQIEAGARGKTKTSPDSGE
jgi:DNA-directed RNA polymerase specialized sigma24 family protein